ncbi:MAG: Lar family restriction alleviation protein [Clostridia bacterium]|nr:Lar family restriction alleviation protein [Clostridia bacterium]
MTKLKPCPFCGGKAFVLEHGKEDLFDGWFTIGCSGRFENGEFTHCQMKVATLARPTKEQAIEVWNTRKGEENG